jgi:osmotically-inducible protein OsmY
MKKHLIILSLFFITSCVETIIIGTAATGVVATRNKSLSDTKKDVIISAKIDQQFINNGLKYPANKIGVTVDEQRVLLTGLVNDEKIIKKANELAWKVGDVKEVIDEIQFSKEKSFFDVVSSYTIDSAITTQIKVRLLFDGNISSPSFKVITVNRICYVIGVAKNSSELKAVNTIIAKTTGIKKVISHIVLSGDKRRN